LSKVFIPNDSGHDFSDAEPFGELVVMSKGMIDKFQVTQMLRVFNSHLKNSKPDDWILQAGPTVMCSIACAAFTALHGQLNLLIHRYEQAGGMRYFQHKVRFLKDG
jgi:hypothetical protein